MTDQEFVFRSGEARIAVNTRDATSLLDRTEALLRRGEGFSVATVNLDHVVKLRRDPEFRRTYQNQDFIVADGNPIVWVSRLAGTPVELVTGADLIEPMSKRAARAGIDVAFFGSTEASLNGAEEALSQRIPGLRVACRISPPQGFDPMSDAAAAMIEEIAASGARLVFVALGAPRQEIFAARCRELAPHLGLVSIGAGLDFLAGHQRRAPRLFRTLALEWAWRMAMHPRRLAHRYALCALLLPRLLAGAALNRFADSRMQPGKEAPGGTVTLHPGE